MKNLLIISSLLLNGILLNAQNTDSNVPFNSNQETNDLTLLVFSGSDWCKPCIKLKKDVIETTKFEDFLSEKIQLQEVDFPYKKANRLSKEQQKVNEALAEKYNPTGEFPSLILINSAKENVAVLKSRDLNGLIDELKKYLGKS